MDPMTLASAAVGMLGPFLAKLAESGMAKAGENMADAAGERLGALYNAVKSRFSGDTYQEAVLRGAEDRPDNPTRLNALEGVLAEVLEADPDFADTLSRLLDAAQAAGVQALRVSDSGAVAGGDVTMRGTYVAGRDLHIGTDGQSRPPAGRGEA